MIANSKKPKRASVKILVSRKDLDETFVGLGAAVEWLACRGKRVSNPRYDILRDEAAIALVDALDKLVPHIAENVVQGVDPANPSGGHVGVPHGKWASVAATEPDSDYKSFGLALVDDESEWGGSITDRFGKGFTRLRIKSAFILDLSKTLRLKHHTDRIFDEKKPARFSGAVARHWMEATVAKFPENFPPLTRTELEDIARAVFPNAPRDKLREIARQIVPSSKRGPRGPRNPDRKQLLDEFRGKVNPAELRN